MYYSLSVFIKTALSLLFFFKMKVALTIIIFFDCPELSGVFFFFGLGIVGFCLYTEGDIIN